MSTSTKTIKLSKNAKVQALHRLLPQINREAFFSVINVPQCQTAVMRYWHESYNIKSWSNRADEEKIAALDAAKDMLTKSLKRIALSNDIKTTIYIMDLAKAAGLSAQIPPEATAVIL